MRYEFTTLTGKTQQINLNNEKLQSYSVDPNQTLDTAEIQRLIEIDHEYIDPTSIVELGE